MSEKTKPDGHEFVRQVLYSQAALSAELYEVKLLLTEVLGVLSNVPAEGLRDRWKAQREEMTDRLYQNSLNETGIEPPTGD